MEWKIPDPACHKDRRIFSGLIPASFYIYPTFLRVVFGMYSGCVREGFGSSRRIPEQEAKETKRREREKLKINHLMVEEVMTCKTSHWGYLLI